ncbi:MAG: prephenate dehydrogenase/arogenate dehydrogenase family protein [Cytophagales bacterium]|nr:prephenate dehydrogenase/arogenate dehydrogenase family protein [Cytophaga sp.]
MRTLGIIGFGGFGQFMVKYIQPHFSITVHDVMDLSSVAAEKGLTWGSLKEAASKDIVVVAVPVQFLEPVLIEIRDFLKPGAIVADVSSVKVKPIELMLKYLPAHVEIIGTHPLFGPQSGKNGIKGLNVVVCPVRTKKARSIIRFLGTILELNVLERTPVTHDKQMAYVQALTHFIGRSINEMDIPDVEQKTPAYQYLLDIKRNLGSDSMDLFLTIELENPYAKEVREQFMGALKNLNDRLENTKR